MPQPSQSSDCNKAVCGDYRSTADGSSIICQLCVEEDTVGDESYLKQDEVCEFFNAMNAQNYQFFGTPTFWEFGTLGCILIFFLFFGVGGIGDKRPPRLRSR